MLATDEGGVTDGFHTRNVWAHRQLWQPLIYNNVTASMAIVVLVATAAEFVIAAMVFTQ